MPIYFAVTKGPAPHLNQRIMMPRAIAVIGSGTEASIIFANVPELAPLHAAVHLEGRDLVIESVDSQPILVKGVLGTKHCIKLNQTFSLGPNFELRYEYTPSAKNAVPPPMGQPTLAELKASSAIIDITHVAIPVEYKAVLQAAVPAKPAVADKPPIQKAAAAKPTAPAKKEPPRAIADVQLPSGDPVTFEELNQISIFAGLPSTQLAKLPGSVVRRRFKKGETICREGEYGYTAFYLLEGACEIFINTPLAHVKSVKEDKATGLFGLFREFKHMLQGRKAVSPEKSQERQYIPIDGPEDLPMNNPVARMRAGDLFGEMSCTSLYPRSATVRALEDCVVLEMLSNVLLALKDNPAYKAKYEKDYRERALDHHLKSVNIFKNLGDNFINQLRNRVELLSYKKGDIIVKEGDPADAFYLIRFGHVRVSKAYPGGELVLNYLGRSEFFGERGLLKGGKRTATCTAVERVECVRIRKPDFDFMLSWYEDVRISLEQIAQDRENAEIAAINNVPSVSLNEFVDQGLMQAQSLLLLDLQRCTRCDECVRACADSHDGVTRLIREGLRFDKYLIATSCRSCLDPVCMPGCPVGSIHRQQSMEILIEDWCIGCGLCAKNCPYGNITMHSFVDQAGETAPQKPTEAAEAKTEGKVEVKKAAPKEKKKAVLCDLCSDLKEPSCVYACPHEAAFRVDARKFFTSGGDVQKSLV